MKLLIGLLLATFSNEVLCSCTVGNAFWLQATKGPKVTQPTQADPTKVLVNWSNMLKKPECVDEFHIYIWRKGVDGVLSQHRDVGPITKSTTSFVVDQINPCVDYYFVVEYREKHKWGGQPTKVRSGKTLHKNTAKASLISRDSSKVTIEYMYRNLTKDHDISKAVIKFGVNDLVKYPNCLQKIEVSGQVQLGRYKRTIGKVPNYGAPRTTSSTGNSWASTVSHSSIGNIVSKQFTPPFRGQNNNVELTVKVSPCKRYTFSLKFIGANGSPIGEVNRIAMKSLDQMSNVILPSLMKVLRLRQRATTLTIDLQPNSPVPASCLLTYIQAVDKQLSTLKTRGLNASPSLLSTSSGNNQILKQNGCACSNSTIVNVTSSDKNVNAKHKDVLGEYTFEGNFHDGKIYYIRRMGPPMNKVYYLFWAKVKNTWWIGDSLSTLTPILKMGDNVAQMLTCPSNPKPQGQFWKRKSTFGWSNDKTMNVTCGQTVAAAVASVAPLGTNQFLFQMGCSCSNTSSVNVSAMDSRTLKKQKTELGRYLFRNGQIHEDKPYYIKQDGAGKRFLFFNKLKNTWWISATLGGSPLVKLEDKAGTSCPENATPKKWTRKNALGIWSKDSTFTVTCGGVELSRGVPRPSPSPPARPAYLANHRCTCSNGNGVNVTSTDSRTLKKHKVELGVYVFKDGQVHEAKPFFIHQAGAVKRYLFFNKPKKSWWISATLGGSAIMKMEDNAGTDCPENATPKKWKRKNAFGVWSKDLTITVKCTASSMSRPGYGTGLPTSRPSYGTGLPTSRPSYGTTPPMSRPSSTTTLPNNILRRSGCQCTKDKIKVSSRDSRTKSKHFDQLGLFIFRGQLYNGKPYYEKLVQAKKYFLFFDVSKKAWNIGETLGGTILLKTEKNFDRMCPADPAGSPQKYWQRKNAFSIWGKDKTLEMECV